MHLYVPIETHRHDVILGLCTCALGLIRPVSTVILTITLPPCRHTAAVLTLVLKIPRAARLLGGRTCWGRSQNSLTYRHTHEQHWRLINNKALTTVCLIWVVTTVIHAVTLPVQTHTHAIGALEIVSIALLLKFRMRGWWKDKGLINSTLIRVSFSFV